MKKQRVLFTGTIYPVPASLLTFKQLARVRRAQALVKANNASKFYANNMLGFWAKDAYIEINGGAVC